MDVGCGESCAPTGAPRTRRADDGKVRRMARRLNRQDCRFECRRRHEGRVTWMWRVMRASSSQVHGCAFGEPRRPLANPQPMDGRRACSRGVPSLLRHPALRPSGRLRRSRAFQTREWATFLWPRKERWHARPGDGRKKTWMSNSKLRASANPHPALLAPSLALTLRAGWHRSRPIQSTVVGHPPRRERETSTAPRQSPICFCRCSRRSCASSDNVAIGRASRRSRPISSSVSSQYP